jgi:predicted nucleic acid-binding protein
VFGRTGKIIRFLSAVVLFELRMGANTPRRLRAVDAIRRAFPTGRVVAPSADLFERAAVIFRALYGNGADIAERLGRVNDLLIALTARSIGAAVVTSNLREFGRIAEHLPGLLVLSPSL